MPPPQGRTGFTVLSARSMSLNGVLIDGSLAHTDIPSDFSIADATVAVILDGAVIAGAIPPGGLTISHFSALDADVISLNGVPVSAPVFGITWDAGVTWDGGVFWS